MPYKDLEKRKQCKRNWNRAHREYFAMWHQQHPEFKENQSKRRACPDAREKRRKYIINHLYGLDWETYQEKLLAQHNTCAICKKSETKVTKSGRVLPLTIDHRHDSSKLVRGLLCSNCNVALGLFCDDALILTSAAQYIQEWQQQGKNNVLT